MAVYPHASKEDAQAIFSRLQQAAGVVREPGVTYDRYGRRVLDSLEDVIGWARAHKLAVVA